MKRALKALFPIFLLTGLLLGLTMTTSAADSGKRGTWVHSPNGWWFECTDGTYPRNGLYEVDGVAYAFDANGYMVTDMIPSSRTLKYKNLLGGILCPEKVKLRY